MKEGVWELVGHIDVDAGICWIGDPCYILHREEGLPETVGKDWSGFCDKLGSADQKTFGHGGKSSEGLGVVVSTGWGDGSYPVFVKRKNGRIAQVLIDFDE
jgi:hypothetical protein